MKNSTKIILTISGLITFSSYVLSHNSVVVVPLGGDSVLSSCNKIKAAGLSHGDGPYTIRTSADGIIGVYCDMSSGTTYESFGLGAYYANHENVGYSSLDVNDWQDEAVQQAFIWHHNSKKGMRKIDPGFQWNNCCFTFSNQLKIHFGGNYKYPADLNGVAVCGGPYSNERYLLGRGDVGSFIDQYPSNYFSDEPVTQETACGVANMNPSIFVKRYQ